MRINSQVDVEQIRREARALAVSAGCDREDADAIVLAVSELATNLVRYAPGGEVVSQRCAASWMTSRLPRARRARALWRENG